MVSLILIYLPALIQPSHNFNLWDYCKKLFKMPNHLHITGYFFFFAYRTVTIWNSLGNDVVMFRNCNTFKYVLRIITCGRALLDCRNWFLHALLYLFLPH